MRNKEICKNRYGSTEAARRMSMFCKYCGEQISYTSKWCGHCGKEAPPLCRYRKAVRRTEVHNSNAKAADASRKSVESREAGPDSAGDLKSFMANTVAVNEAKSFYDGDTAQVSHSAPQTPPCRPPPDDRTSEKCVPGQTRQVPQSELPMRSPQ